MPALALASTIEPEQWVIPLTGERPRATQPPDGAFEPFRATQRPTIPVAGENRTTMNGATMMANLIEVAVQREVQSVVQQQLEKISARAAAGAKPAAVRDDGNIVSETGIRDLIRRMKELTREERFRCGELR